jgi:hypothetical protein
MLAEKLSETVNRGRSAYRRNLFLLEKRYCRRSNNFPLKAMNDRKCEAGRRLIEIFPKRLELAAF